MTVDTIQVARGHVIVMFTDGRNAFITGELTLKNEFYVFFRGTDWKWITRPERSVYFLKEESVLGDIADEDKEDIIAALNEYTKGSSFRAIIDYR